MISLMLALLASPVANGQAVQATLQSCALENNRYVCRYAVPDIVIVPVPGTNITADAPAAVLGSAPSADSASTAPSSTAGVPTWAVPMAEGHSHGTATTTIVPTPSSSATVRPTPTPPVTATTTEPGPIHPIDAGVLTEREAQLVARCAEAGWMSLCLPADRHTARELRDKQGAYQAVRREVSRLIGDSRCDAAVRTALDGGYLSLARETREYCATTTAAATPARTPAARPQPARIMPAPPAGPARPSVLSELETKAAAPGSN